MAKAVGPDLMAGSHNFLHDLWAGASPLSHQKEGRLGSVAVKAFEDSGSPDGVGAIVEGQGDGPTVGWASANRERKKMGGRAVGEKGRRKSAKKEERGHGARL